MSRGPIFLFLRNSRAHGVPTHRCVLQLVIFSCYSASFLFDQTSCNNLEGRRVSPPPHKSSKKCIFQGRRRDCILFHSLLAWLWLKYLDIWYGASIYTPALDLWLTLIKSGILNSSHSSPHSLPPSYSFLCSPSPKLFPEKNTVFSRLV